MEKDEPVFLHTSLAWNVQQLRLLFSPSEDLYLKPIRFGGVQGMLCSFEGLSDLERLWVMAGDAFSRIKNRSADGTQIFDWLLTETVIPLDKSIALSLQDIIRFITAGASVILLDGCDRAIVVSSQGQPSRSLGEPSGEGNLRGSHEGFVELLRINLGLVRRLIRTSDLHTEIYVVGTRTHTEVALLYCSGTCPEKMLETVRKCLQNTNLPLLFDPGYLTPFLVQGTFSFFTPAGFTERPDTASAKLCEGKAVLLVNGSPFALIVPHFFCEHFQSMDDYIQRPYFSSFIRLLKYAAFFISVILPGAFVAATNFAPELLSTALLYKIAGAQLTTPLPLFGEVLAVDLLIEILREAGLRLPKSIGHAVGLVAALIIGDAAVQIGLLGTPVLVVCALAGLCSYVVPSLYEPATMLRIGFILAGGLAGPVGMAMLGAFCLLDLCRPSPFGIPYTAPAVPFQSNFWKDGIFRASWRRLNERHPFRLEDLSAADGKQNKTGSKNA